MIKKTPSLARIAAMIAFALSCFAIVMFLWITFGGPIPLQPEGYRVQVAFPEAATLAEEADVRISGVNVGKVKTKRLDKGGARTIAEIELDGEFAPIPRDTRAILRQKTLLGETYVELSTGDRSSGMLDDGGRLPDSQVEPTVELDEIFGAFDESTRRAFQEWVKGLAKASEGQAPEDLNDAFGNMAPFATDGAELLRVLDEQETAVHELFRNTGRGLRGDQRARRRAAAADRQLEQHVRGGGVARRGAGRDVPDLPGLPRRVEGDAGAARGLLARHAPARERPQGPGRRPRPDGARPR